MTTRMCVCVCICVMPRGWAPHSRSAATHDQGGCAGSAVCVPIYIYEKKNNINNDHILCLNIPTIRR